MSFLFENTALAFIVITLVLGGGAAWLTGRAIARTWGPVWQAIGYMVPLTMAARFLHFALADGLLLSVYYFAVNLIILSAFAAVAFQTTRAWQMEAQYPWLYRRTSPFTWTNA